MSDVSGAESEFRFDELLFSRTDSKGKIRAANSIFQRVSKYGWERLHLKPHNVIRHPSMPRGVFRLLWDRLLSGEQVGAYVVNRAEDGTHYWVFALAFPTEGGYLSVRIKPSSRIFQIVRGKYAELLELEASRRISPLESKAILLEEIGKLGFRDYAHFMAEALAREIEARQQAVGKEPIHVLTQLLAVSTLGSRLQDACRQISSAYAQAALVPLNLEVRAARIGREAAPLAVISSQYDVMAKQIDADIKKLLEAANAVENQFSSSCKFDVGSLLLLEEAIAFFNGEEADEHMDKDCEMKLLRQAGQKNLSASVGSLGVLATEFDKFRMVQEAVRRQAATLEIVSITGKIEAAKVSQSAELLGLLDELAAFKTVLKDRLVEIENAGHALIGLVQQIRWELARL
jgi:aerotaxis receptor